MTQPESRTVEDRLATVLWDTFSSRPHAEHDPGDCETCDWYRKLSTGSAADLLAAAQEHGLVIGEQRKLVHIEDTVAAVADALRAMGLMEEPLPGGTVDSFAADLIYELSKHGLVIGEGELDAAWKEAEAALPDGWAISDVRRRSVNGRYSASATLGGSEIGVNTSGHTSGLGVTPAAALRDLAERLRR